MSPYQVTKILVVISIIGYLVIAESEARNLDEQEVARYTRSVQNDLDQALLDEASSNLDQIDADDLDDDEDDRSGNPSATQRVAASTNQRYQTAPSNDLKTSASHHHHGHGAKGWLDMGAWTGKKGAFGWYDKHPVGGKKGK